MRIDMNPTRGLAVFAAVVLSIGLSTARSESKAETEVADNFEVKWTRISYTKTVSLKNSEDSEDQDQDVSERMSLSCEVKILDPNFVLGISRAPIIEEMTDDKGGEIEIDSKPSSPLETRYEAPRHERRFVAPTRPAKWKTAIRSALRLPPKASSRPRLVEEIRPSQMQIDLDVGLGEKSTEKISRVKGYFYALIAESFEYVDVPFKKSDKWVRLTPDLEVQVRDAFCDGSSYRLSTKARPEGGGITGWLSVESYMPTRLVTGRQLIGPGDKLVRRYPGHHLPYSPGRDSGGGGTSMGEIKKIRFVIAVNAAHYEIPFVLENIPVPKP